MEAQQLIKLFEKEKHSSERGNFNTLTQAAAEWCNPPMDNIENIKSPGDRKKQGRYIDIGIKARRMCTAGLMSHLFPQGQSWIRVVPTDRDLLNNDNVVRALTSVTKKFASAIEESNFYEEMGSSIDALTYIGTTALYCESTKKSILNWRSHFYKSFFICENYQGEVDTVIREFKQTARQALQQFGDETPEKIRLDAQEVSTSSKEYTFVHFVMPRTDGFVSGSDKKEQKAIASYYVCLETKEIVKESGYDEMPYSVGRFYRTNYEKYGRSCAMEVGATLPMVNDMESTRIRSAERVASPPWLSPNDGSVRRISNDQGSIIYWNAGNPMSKPEQLQVRDNPMVNDDMISKKEEEILEAFYVPLFNPLHDKQNMTATETGERLNLSLQFLTPAVNRLNRYFVRPALDRAFGIMLRAKKFPELQIPELDGVKLDFDLVGKASLAARQIELYGTMTALEQIGLVGQVKPEIWDNVNADKTARFIQEVNMVPVALQASEKEVAQVRETRQEDAERRLKLEEAQVTSDAYSKTTKAPEGGSGAEAMVEQLG